MRTTDVRVRFLPRKCLFAFEAEEGVKGGFKEGDDKEEGAEVWKEEKSLVCKDKPRISGKPE